MVSRELQKGGRFNSELRVVTVTNFGDIYFCIPVQREVPLQGREGGSESIKRWRGGGIRCTLKIKI